MKVLAVIPARMGSTRFPGKPLVRFDGLPMVEHVRRRAVLSGAFSDVVVATCDDEIRTAIQGFGGRVVMTSVLHEAATDRVAEATAQFDCTHVVNVQGDEILVLPKDLARLVAAIRAQPEVPAWNAVGPVESAADLDNPSLVKCVVSTQGRVLVCSRRLGHLGPKLGATFVPVCIILGILAFRRDFLLSYGRLSRTPLEQAESIDQNRIVEHDVRLQTIPFQRAYIGINEPGEVALVEGALRHDADQTAILKELKTLQKPSI